MLPVVLKFNSFSRTIETPQPTIRDMQANDVSPLDHKPNFGGQRVYDGKDIFAWGVFDALRDAGLKRHQAAKAVRCSGAVEEFLEAISAGKDASDHLLCFAQGKPDDEKGGWYRLHYRALRAGDMGAFLTEATAEGRELHSLVTVQLLPIYRRAKARALAKGYVLNGPDLYRADEFNAAAERRATKAASVA